MSFASNRASGSHGYTLCHVEGARIGPFATLAEVVHWLNAHHGGGVVRQGWLGTAFRVSNWPFQDRLHKYVLRDAWDLPVDPAILTPEWDRLWAARMPYRFRAVPPVGTGMPVPYTGRRSGGHWYRRPTNHALRRASVDDQLPLVRAAIRHPVSDRDDICRAKPEKSWKSYRRTQWRSAPV